MRLLASRLRTVALLGLGLALLAYLISKLPSPTRLLDAALAVPPKVWAAALAGWLVSYGLRAQRLRDEWAGRVRLGFGEALHVTLLHSAAINLIPLRAGEASYPWMLHRRFGIRLGDAVASLLWLRVQDVVVLGLLGVALLWPMGEVTWRAVGALGLLVVSIFAVRGVAQRWQPRRDKLARLAEALRRDSWRGWGWTVANWSVKSGASALLLSHLLGASWARLWPAAVAGEMGGALPVHVPAGFGAYEAAVWLGTGWSGDSERVLGAALLCHAALVLQGVVAAGVSQLMSSSKRWRMKESTP